MALSAARNTPERDGEVFDFPVKGSTTVYQGSLVALNAGYAAPGAAATGRVAVGRAEDTVANGGSDGAVSVRVKRGIFRFANSAAGDAITQAEAGATCYIVDDQTVAKTDGTGTRSAAGKIIAVDSLGVWVQIGLGL
jgi:hypothetical protein